MYLDDMFGTGEAEESVVAEEPEKEIDNFLAGGGNETASLGQGV